VIRLRAARFAGRVRLVMLLPLGLLLGGCEWQTFKSSVAGSCAVFERPPYAVRGKAAYDQDVVDNFVESGVAGCNWTRPAPRPPQLDAPAGRKVAVASPPKARPDPADPRPRAAGQAAAGSEAGLPGRDGADRADAAAAGAAAAKAAALGDRRAALSGPGKVTLGMGVNLDLTISLGTIIETLMIGGGGIAALVTLRNTVTTLKGEMATSKQETKQQFDGIQSATRAQFDGIQSELKKMGEILIGMARFDERLMNLDKRVTSQGRQIDELRRGEGWITARAQHGRG
jgi:hypothetical protein